MPRFSRDHKPACEYLTKALGPLAVAAAMASTADRALVQKATRACMLAQQWARSPAEANRRNMFESIRELELQAEGSESRIARATTSYAEACREFGTVHYGRMYAVLASVIAV